MAYLKANLFAYRTFITLIAQTNITAPILTVNSFVP